MDLNLNLHESNTVIFEAWKNIKMKTQRERESEEKLNWRTEKEHTYVRYSSSLIYSFTIQFFK